MEPIPAGHLIEELQVDFITTGIKVPNEVPTSLLISALCLQARCQLISNQLIDERDIFLSKASSIVVVRNLNGLFVLDVVLILPTD